jgi:hypothetical protein
MVHPGWNPAIQCGSKACYIGEKTHIDPGKAFQVLPVLWEDICQAGGHTGLEFCLADQLEFAVASRVCAAKGKGKMFRFSAKHFFQPGAAIDDLLPDIFNWQFF